MTFEGAYKIMVQDDAGHYSVCIYNADANSSAGFDCVYAAEQYAKLVGLKSGYIIKK